MVYVCTCTCWDVQYYCSQLHCTFGRAIFQNAECRMTLKFSDYRVRKLSESGSNQSHCTRKVDSPCFLTLIAKLQIHLAFCILHSAFSILHSAKYPCFRIRKYDSHQNSVFSLLSFRPSHSWPDYSSGCRRGIGQV